MANDLKSRDWLIHTTKHFLRTIDPSIITDIQYTGDGGRVLIVSNVSEETLDKLAFITNTDKNNNYGYLEDFKVFIKGELEPVDLGDFSETVLDLFRSSDADAFLNDKKTHTPFAVSNLKNTPAFNTEGKRFADYVDFISGTLQGSRSTYGLVKLFEFVFNPDARQNGGEGTIADTRWKNFSKEDRNMLKSTAKTYYYGGNSDLFNKEDDFTNSSIAWVSDLRSVLSQTVSGGMTASNANQSFITKGQAYQKSN